MTEKQFNWFVSSLVVFAALLAYANTLANDFVWDDASSVLLHEHVHDPSKFFQLFLEDQHAFGRGQGNFYRPLVSASFMVEYWLSRPADPAAGGPPTLQMLSPYLFHLDNAVLHALAALAMFALLRRFGAPRFVQAAAPLLYVVHPLHTEAVAYISGRADSLSTLFIVFALCAATSSKLKNPALWSGVLFIAGLLSKESAAVYPFLLLFAFVALRFSKERGLSDAPNKPGLLPLITAGVLLGAYAALRITVLHFGTPSTAAIPFGTRLTQAGQAFALYLKLIFLPVDLHMERTLDGVPAWLGAAGWLIVALFILTTLVSLVAKRHRLAFALGFFLITWLPISGVFTLNAPMAEHWMYLPLIGFVWALVELLWMLVGKTPLRFAAYPAVYAACVVFITLTAARNHDWRTNESIYAATLEQNPNSIRVTYNLGVTYEDITGNPSGARREYERVLALYERKKAENDETDKVFYDDETESHLSLAEIYMQDNRPDLAAPHYEAVRRVQVTKSNEMTVAKAYLNYARLLTNLGRGDDAKKLLQEGTARVPELKSQMDAFAQSQAQRNATSQAPSTPEQH